MPSTKSDNSIKKFLDYFTGIRSLILVLSLSISCVAFCTAAYTNINYDIQQLKSNISSIVLENNKFKSDMINKFDKLDGKIDKIDDKFNLLSQGFSGFQAQQEIILEYVREDIHGGN